MRAENMACHSEMHAPVDLFLELVEQVSLGRPCRPELVRWFNCAAARWLADGGRLDDALGLRPAAGQIHPANVLRLKDRDRAVCIAAMHYAEASHSATAKRLREALGRYEVTGWKRDRASLTCPHHSNSPAAALWHVLKHSEGKGLSARSIRKILAGNPDF